MTNRIARSIVFAGGLFVAMIARVVKPVFLGLTICAGLVLVSVGSASAYVIYGPTVSGIWGINPQTGTTTKYFTFATPFTNTIAAMAQRQSDGMIFFISGNAGNDPVYTWNPATPSTAPVQIGTTGTGIPYSPRLAFDTQTNVLYAIDTNANPKIYTVDQTTGAFTATGKTITGLPSGGGDLAIDTDGTWYIAVASTMYKTTVNGGAATTIGTMALGGASITGLALGTGNNLIGADSNAPSGIWTISKTTGAATSTGKTINDGTNSVGDLAGIFATDVALSKTDNGPWSVTQSTQATYTLSVANNGNIATSGTLTVTDTLPTGVTYQSASGTGWSCNASGQTVTCTSSSVIAAGGVGNPITVNVAIDGVTGTSITNTASVAGGGSPAYLSYDATASDTTTITLASAGPMFIGPYDSTNITNGSQYTGSFDGIAAASNNYDFTARAIPFPSGTSLINTSTTPGAPVGAAITAASVALNVPNALYYLNNNTANTLTFTVTAPSAPAGWTAQICPDNGSGAPACTSAGSAGSCAGTNTWLIGAAGATSTSSCLAAKRTAYAVRFWVVYQTPASGLTAFTRYDARVRGDDGTGGVNDTHNEIYSGFVAVTKSANVLATNCRPGTTPTLPVSDSTGAKTCPGGTVRYTLDYRNIVAGAGIGTQGAFAPAFITTSNLTIGDDGTLGTNNWSAQSSGLIVGLSNALASPSNCGVGSGACGDSMAGTTFTYDGAHPTGAGATKFTATIGGPGFALYPIGFSGQSGQGTIVFAIKLNN